MPHIADRLAIPEGYDVEQPVQRATPSVTVSTDAEPKLSSVLACPMPLVRAYPDSLRQFYRQGVPQTRIVPIL